MESVVEREQDRALISTSTILILSGFLLGISVAQPLSDISFQVFACGMTGIVAYLTFEVTNLHKEKESMKRDQKLMETRLKRHLAANTQPVFASEQEKHRLLEWLNSETEDLPFENRFN